MKVFWSWQDDSPGKTNRHFIKAALEQAIKALEGEFEFEDAERPSLDHDTKGIAGAKEIVPAIMAKIAESAVFVADVTPIAETAAGKALPNPNVLVELGWSLNKPGDGRQIYVLNTGEGWTVEGLPFDIRHRRVLTYSLSETADKTTRDRVTKSLVRDLTSAIRTNLTEHLNEKAEATPALGVAARSDEPSIWEGGEQGFRHQDSFGPNHWTEVVVQGGPRSYLRVIPSGWRNGAPSVAAIGALDINVAPYAQSYARSGDFGATREGYVRYWIASREGDPVETRDVAMFFEDTGEFWILHGSCVGGPEGRPPSVDLTDVFRNWSTALRRIHWLFDRFGALPARRVELGFTGFDEVRFPGGWESARPPARRGSLKVEQVRRDWSQAETQETFLVEALNQVFGLFGVARRPADDALNWVRSNDPERQRDNPFT